RAGRGDQGAGQRGRHQGDAGAHQRPRRVQEVPAGPARARWGVEPVAGHRGAVPRAEVQPELPGAAEPARGHRDPTPPAAHAVPRGRTRLQHQAAHLPRQPGRVVSRVQRKAVLRSGARQRAGAKSKILTLQLHRSLRPAFRRAGWAVLLLALAVAASAALKIPPPPQRRVNDYGGALSATDVNRLEQKLIDRERTSSNQVVVAIFRSLEGESLEDFSIRLAQAWRVGQKGLDNGVIFLVFLDDRKMRIEVGYGLEPTLTDAIASSIIRNVVAPRFREGRITDGIAAGLD